MFFRGFSAAKVLLSFESTNAKRVFVFLTININTGNLPDVIK